MTTPRAAAPQARPRRTRRVASSSQGATSAELPVGKGELAVSHVMTPQPVTIGRDQTLTVAHEMMRHHGIRHLPVLEHGDLVGVLSQRDLYFLETIAGADLDSDRVEEAMSQDAYAVPPDAKLSDVAGVMAARKYGCAVVMERGRVAGIFTATDALRVLAGILPRTSPRTAKA